MREAFFMLNKVIENLYKIYDLNEDTVFKGMDADELTTFIMAYNEVLFFNNEHYIDLWDYNSKDASLFYEAPYNAIKNIIINNNINSYKELRDDCNAFDGVLKVLLNL